MSSMVSAIGIFVHNELISKLHIKLLLALDRVRKVLAKPCEILKTNRFTGNCASFSRGGFKQNSALFLITQKVPELGSSNFARH